MTPLPFTKNILIINDIASTCAAIEKKLHEVIFHDLRRTGAVIGISGGIDSSVCFALATRVCGKKKVTGIMLPEKDSSPDSSELAQKLADKLGVENIITENITGALEGFGCYERRDAAVSYIFPEYDPSTHKMKIGIQGSGLFTNLPPLFTITIIDRDGKEQSKRAPADVLRQIIAATNFKQRCRMSMLYYHAERMHYAVVGSPNKHESEQGFFVKYGDGGADVMPIAHLYKTQVYQLAEYLGVPEEIIKRTPTTDTYSAEQTQEEFFYQLPFEKMDLLWYAYENSCNIDEVAGVLNMTVDNVRSVYVNFDRKKLTTEYLRMAPVRF